MAAGDAIADTANGIGAPGNATRVYHITNDFEKVVSSGRAWGQTEGSVYGMRIPNASRLRTWMKSTVRDQGIVIFEDEAANLFKPHPFEGPYSLLKRALG